MTLDEFKKKLKDGHYSSLAGARRAISRSVSGSAGAKMKETDAKLADQAAKRKLAK